MFDRLVEEAGAVSSWMGEPGIIHGIQWIGAHLDEYDEGIQREYRGFMRLGRDLFAPAE